MIRKRKSPDGRGPPAREATLEKESPGASPEVGRKGIRTDGRTKL